MKVRVGLVVLAAAVVVLAGCGSDGEGESARTIPEGPPPACNPVAAELDCLAPYPSNVFLVRDATTRSGARVEIPATALPKDITGRPFDVSRLYGADGFPIGTQVFALLGEAIDPGNLPTYDPQRPELLERSLARNSPTVLLDTVTGQRVLHLAEPDPRATSGRRQALLVRPLVRLTPGRRYIVALRDLRSPTGVLLPSPDGFRQIRDRQVVAPELVPWAQRYEREIFPVLEAAIFATCLGLHGPHGRRCHGRFARHPQRRTGAAEARSAAGDHHQRRSFPATRDCAPDRGHAGSTAVLGTHAPRGAHPPRPHLRPAGPQR